MMVSGSNGRKDVPTDLYVSVVDGIDELIVQCSSTNRDGGFVIPIMDFRPRILMMTSDLLMSKAVAQPCPPEWARKL